MQARFSSDIPLDVIMKSGGVKYGWGKLATSGKKGGGIHECGRRDGEG
jgi:hypothetical protein